MKNYKFKGEEKTHFIIHDGESDFKVAKVGLEPHTLKKIKGLAKYADGGEVEPADIMQGAPAEEAAMPMPEAPVAPQAAAPTATDMEMQHAAQQNAAEQVPQAPQPTAPQPQAAPVPGQIPGVQGTMLSQFQQNVAQQEAGIKQQAGAQADIAKKTADVYGALYSPEQQQKAQEVLGKLQAQQEVIMKRGQDLYKAAYENKIDPNKYWHDKSTASKIGSAIAIFLGALGGGNNGALQIIQHKIDQDVEAQRENIHNKQSLYSLNLQEYRDNTSAQAATRIQLNAIAQGQIARAAAQSGTPMAQAQAAQAIAQLKNNSLMMMGQLYSGQLALQAKQALVGGTANGVNLEYLDKDTRERVVPTPVGLKIAPTKEDAESAKKTISSLGSIDQQTKQMQQLVSKHNVSIHVPFSESRAEYQSLRSSLTTELNQLQGLNRLTEKEFQSFENMIPSESEFFTNAGHAKLAKLRELTAEKLNNEMSVKLQGGPQIPMPAKQNSAEMAALAKVPRRGR